MKTVHHRADSARRWRHGRVACCRGRCRHRALGDAAPVAGAARVTSPKARSVAGLPAVKVPTTPVGKQLEWLLGVGPRLPLSTKEISAHFDAAFLAQVSTAELNQALESLGPPGSTTTLLGLSQVEATSLVALVQIGASPYSVQLSVDGAGLIAGLIFRPAANSVPHSWSQVDKQLTAIAPQVSFLAAKVGSDGTCSAVHSVLAGTPRPLGSMFKLFVLGALANAVHDHRISWSQKVTVTAAIKVGGSGTLQNSPDGTKLTVEQVAVKMISISDNTAADMLLNLVGRAAVEDQVRAWSSHASLDIPFLTVKELFALKYHDFPGHGGPLSFSHLIAAGLVPCHDGRQGTRRRRTVSQPAPRHQLDRMVRFRR